MEITVVFFASLTEATGCRDVRVEATDKGSMLGGLKERFGQDAFDALTETGVKIALNQEIVEDDFTLTTGDEVAFLPPVTGG